jgi:hypothetical protein
MTAQNGAKPLSSLGRGAHAIATNRRQDEQDLQDGSGFWIGDGDAPLKVNP